MFVIYKKTISWSFYLWNRNDIPWKTIFSIQTEACMLSLCVDITVYMGTAFSLEHFVRGRLTHIFVGNVTIIGLDNGLSPGRRQSIFLANAGILLIQSFETNFSEMFTEFIYLHSRTYLCKCRPRNGGHLASGLNVLIPAVDAVIHKLSLAFETQWRCLTLSEKQI